LSDPMVGVCTKRGGGTCELGGGGNERGRSTCVSVPGGGMEDETGDWCCSSAFSSWASSSMDCWRSSAFLETARKMSCSSSGEAEQLGLDIRSGGTCSNMCWVKMPMNVSP